MKPRIKKKPWHCLLTSFAIATGIPEEKFITSIGHDGSEIVNDLPEPSCRRGFHHQEIVYAAWCFDWAVTRLQMVPSIKTQNGDTIVVSDLKDLFLELISTEMGVIMGSGSATEHAVAFCENEIYCPDSGTQYEFSLQACEARRFYAREILVLNKRAY